MTMVQDNVLKQAIQSIAQNQKHLHALLGSEFLDHLAISKHIETRNKIRQNHFNADTKIYFGDHLKHVTLTEDHKSYAVLDKDFLSQPLGALPSQCIYFLLNNDIGSALEQYKLLFKNRPCSLFVIWDWDSQHWVEMSCTLAAYSDFYIPVASENTYTISHFNPFMLGPVFVGVNQWSKKFITDHTESLLQKRNDAPFGPHVFYEAYPRRNRAIATLNQKFSGIKFADNSYKVTSDIDNLNAWSGHKTHWIIPVLSGMPIRVFNCLITGGIPLVPSFYKVISESTDLPKDVMYYDVIDLVEPEKLQQRANDYFDQQGTSGLIQRIGNYLNTYHIDARCESILKLVQEKVNELTHSQ
jgi:hypothetical protein